ncbi:MAG: tetratricopeptide repeat protein [Myxococcaceae bacterium]
MRRTLVAVLAVACLGGCIAHEKSGDKAATLGDWKSAYVHYRNAIGDNDEVSPALRQKYEEARVKALIESKRRGDSCAQTGDWSCALEEGDFALQADPTNPEVATFRAHAAQKLAENTLGQARASATQGRYPEAVSEFRRATTLANTGDQAESTRREIVSLGHNSLAELTQSGRFDEALKLARTLTPLDGSFSSVAHDLEQQRLAAQTMERDNLIRDGDWARAARDWPRAVERYQAAGNQGRAPQLAAYSQWVMQGENALTLRDFPTAINAYREAIRTGVDDGFAAQRLESVEPHPYRIALRSALILAGRSDGQAWIGPSTPLFYRAARALEDAAQRRGYRAMEEAAASIPYENRPNLRLEVTLPDGSRLGTPARPGVLANFDSELVLISQGVDDRPLTFQVLAGNDIVGTVDVGLRELLEKPELRINRGAILSILLVSTRADGRQPGTFVNMNLLTPGAAPAPGTGIPPPGTPTPVRRPSSTPPRNPGRR